MRTRKLALGLTLLFVLTGCWAQRGFDAGHSNASPLATTVNAANVGGLTARFTATAGSAAGPSWSVIWGAALFVRGASLRAYDAGGVAGCTGPAPATCVPRWTSRESSGFLAGPVADAGRVWGVVSGRLVAYDTAGGTNCSGVPRECSPIVDVTLPVNLTDSLTVTSDGIYLTGTTQVTPGVFSETLLAYDGHGVARWKASLGTNTIASPSAVSAEGDRVYVPLRTGGVGAFDARGVNGCSGAPVVCTPLWKYPAPAGAPAAGITVHDGRVFLSSPTEVDVFDSKGVNGCAGTPKTCSPLWRTSGGTFDLAVTGDHLYAAGPTATSVYSLGGAGCSGSPLVCTPLWTDAPTGSPYALTTVTVAGDVVYTSTLSCDATCNGVAQPRVDAHSATGTIGCSGAPKVCQPLWSTPVASMSGPAMVVGDTVYVPGWLALAPVGPDPVVTAFRV